MNMKNMFKNSKVVISNAPEEPETKGEIDYMENISSNKKDIAILKVDIREVILENNLILREILNRIN